MDLLYESQLNITKIKKVALGNNESDFFIWLVLYCSERYLAVLVHPWTFRCFSKHEILNLTGLTLSDDFIGRKNRI